MITVAALRYSTLSILVVISLLLSGDSLLPASHVYTIFPSVAFAQQTLGSAATTTPATASPTAEATVVPISELGRTARPSSIVLMNIEDLRAADRTGDAEVSPSSLRISNAFNDEESSHEIQYFPGSLGFAGIAYEADKNYDLSNAQRVVFFAKGQNGGENVTFAAVGRNENTAAALNTTDEISGSPFNNQNFSLISEDVTLDRDWKRYQLSLEGVNLDSISHPFAFVVNQGPGPEPVAFSLRDITYDSKPATESLDIVEQDANQTDLSAVTFDTQSNNTGLSNSTQDSSPFSGPEELAGNSTEANASLGEANTNATTDRFGIVPNNDTQVAFNPGGQRASDNSSSVIGTLPTTLPNASNFDDPITSGNNDSDTAIDGTDSSNSINTTEPNNFITNSNNIGNDIANDNKGGGAALPNNANQSTGLASGTDQRTHVLDSGYDFDGSSVDNADNISSNSVFPSSIPPVIEGNDQILRNPEGGPDFNINNATLVSETQSQSLTPFGGSALQYPLAQNENQTSLLGSSSQSNIPSSDSGNQLATNTISPDNVTFPPIIVTPALQQLQPQLQQQLQPQLQQQLQPQLQQQLQQEQQSPSTVLPESSDSNDYDPTALDTVIISAIDSVTGSSIQSGSATTSSSITFTFEGSGPSGISGYTCSIENLEPFSCSSPVIYDTSILTEAGLDNNGDNNGDPSRHSFQVSAIDSSGNADSTPSTFEWSTGSTEPETLQPETLQPETLPPETLPPETLPPETLPPETLPPETLPPQTLPPQTLPPQLPTTLQPQTQQQHHLPQITVQGPLTSNGFAPSELPTTLQPQTQQQHHLPQITVQGPLTADAPFT